MIKDAYLDNTDANVIIMDWSPLSRNFLYFLSKWDTRKVGKQLTKFIEFLLENGAKLPQFHLIGHSLGAHICGFAGSGTTNGRVARITGKIKFEKYTTNPASPSYLCMYNIFNPFTPIRLAKFYCRY